MQISKENSGTIITFSYHDVFKRQFILMSSKLIDEEYNNWFRTYLKRYKNVDISTSGARQEDNFKRIELIKSRCTKLLSEKFGFGEFDYNVAIIEFKGTDITPNKSQREYTIKNRNGNSLTFHNFNGYWFECDNHPEYVFFDYGDFYCMGDVLPLATFFVIIANKWRMDHK